MVLNKLYGYRKFFLFIYFYREIFTYEYHNFLNVQGRREQVDKVDILPDYTK